MTEMLSDRRLMHATHPLFCEGGTCESAETTPGDWEHLWRKSSFFIGDIKIRMCLARHDSVDRDGYGIGELEVQFEVDDTATYDSPITIDLNDADLDKLASFVDEYRQYRKSVAKSASWALDISTEELVQNREGHA